LINLFAAVILLLAFAMLAQRRMPALINLFALQGLALCLATLVAAVTTGAGAPVLLGRADAGAQGPAAALDPAPAGAPAQGQAARSRP
jgi:multisubunit Na+/H+ antiporter MnhC subunit